jgi:hypothetical protein
MLSGVVPVPPSAHARFIARITPIRANIVGPFLFSHQDQRFHRSLPFLGIVFSFGSLVM